MCVYDAGGSVTGALCSETQVLVPQTITYLLHQRLLEQRNQRVRPRDINVNLWTHTQVYTGKLKYTLTQTVTELACQEHRWLGKNKRLNQYSMRALNWVTCAFSLPVKGGNPSGPKLHTQSIFKTSYTQNLHEFTWKADSTASGRTHTGGDPSVSSGSLLFSSLSLFLLPSYVWRNGFVVMQVTQRPPKYGSLVFTAIPRPLRLWPQ